MSESRISTAVDSRKTLGRAKPDVMMPVPDTLAAMPEGYPILLSGIKEIITRERIKAVMSANIAMVLMYWDIGQFILRRQQQEGWGARVIDRLSHDLKTAFPDMTGFSPRNLKYMRKLPKPGRIGQLCNAPLHNCPGAAIWRYWINSAIRIHGFGMPIRLWNLAWARTCWFFKSRIGSMNARARPSTIFIPPCHQPIRT